MSGAFSLDGLTLAPAQVCGAFRLVPLLRERPRADLRLARRSYGDSVGIVDLGQTVYSSYIPHGLVIGWESDGSAVVATGSQLASPKSGRPEGKSWRSCSVSFRLLHRMAKREGRGAGENRLRLLPLHLAFESYLALHFGGPELKWSEYSRQAISHGLSPRSEWVIDGSTIDGFDEALRVFEIHENQVGVLAFVADALATAFVTPHPDDYRLLHDALLEDFYGELIAQYALLYNNVADARATIDTEKIGDLTALRSAVGGMRDTWSEFAATLANGLLGVDVNPEVIYRLGPFALERFTGDLNPEHENHLGERIVDTQTGELLYLKTFRLSGQQVRRAYLLNTLARHDWHIERTAEALQTTSSDLLLRFERAGFGFLFHQHVMDHARKDKR